MISVNQNASQLLSSHNEKLIDKLLVSDDFIEQKVNVLLPFGFDADDDLISCALEALPHLLISGTTGSGKTAYIQSMLASLASLYSSDDLKFLLYDSKGVEYSDFNGLNNLILPVIKEHQKAIAALSWLCTETMNRQKLLIESGLRNIEEYNTASKTKLPYIMAVLDDISQISMLCGVSKIEDSLQQILSVGRLIGIHVIISTSLPTSKIIPSSIKASLPSRLSFRVASKADSRMALVPCNN